MWGRNVSQSILNTTAEEVSTPVYLPLPGIEKAVDLRLGAYVAMVLSDVGNVYFRGVDGAANAAGFASLPVIKPYNQWVTLNVAGETGFKHINCNAGGYQSVVIGTSGKAYRAGLASDLGGDVANTYTQIPFPSGVTGFTTTWMDTYFREAYMFLKGNNGKIYALGRNDFGALGSGNLTNIAMNATPVEVLFPAGVDIVDISSAEGINLALAADGTGYVWGTLSTNPGRYIFAASPTATDKQTNVYGTHIIRPVRLNLPTLKGDTKFTLLRAAREFTVAVTDKGAYFKGYNTNNIMMNPVIYQGTVANYEPNYYDGTDPDNYNNYAPVYNKLKDLIFSYRYSAHIITASGRGYAWGSMSFNLAGDGGGIGTNPVRPIPIGTGIGDPRNVNPLY
jgi:hypothetical protein